MVIILWNLNTIIETSASYEKEELEQYYQEVEETEKLSILRLLMNLDSLKTHWRLLQNGTCWSF